MRARCLKVVIKLMAALNKKYRTALVTGVSSGLGRGLTEMLLAEGIRVWGTARRTEAIAPFVSTGFELVVLDLEDTAGARAAVRRAEAVAGGVFDLVILNAGHGLFAPFAAAEWRGWELQLQALIVTNAGLAHQLTPAMVARRRGCLVVVTGPSGEFQTGLTVAQSALSGLALSLMDELTSFGVRVMEFRCDWMHTDFLKHMPAARLTVPEVDDERMKLEWARLRRNVETASGPGKSIGKLRQALEKSTASGVLNAGPGAWRRFGRGLLVWMGVRSGKKTRGSI